MDTCIALRTIVIQGNTAYVQAGAGIVADSVPKKEYQEVLAKSAILRRALEIAAAGRHHMFLIGSPGAGKTMLARYLAPA